MLNLNSFMIGTEDYQKLGDFYGAVLQKKPEMNDKDSKMVGYLAGSSFISIMPHSKVQGKSQNPERIMFSFETSEVEKEFERIKQIPGASVVAEPYHPGGMDKYSIATLADPDGNYFQLLTPWDDDVKNKA